MTTRYTALLLLATCAYALAQQQPATPTAGQRAVATVLHQSVINPLQLVDGTNTPLSSQGKWSVVRQPVPGCAPSAECVKTLYTVNESNIVCEWTVQLAPDGGDGVILDENENAEKYLLRRLKPEEAAAAILHSEAAVYPAIACAAHVRGVVRIGQVVAKDGIPLNANPTEGPAMLRGSAVYTAKTWTFKPLLLNDRPIAWTSTDLAFNFELNSGCSGGRPAGRIKGAFLSKK